MGRSLPGRRSLQRGQVKALGPRVSTPIPPQQKQARLAGEDAGVVTVEREMVIMKTALQSQQESGWAKECRVNSPIT